MLVGILSDTHDRIEAAVAGMELLRRNGAQFYIHCGDVGGQRILDELAGLPAALVWGNNDWDRRGLERYAGALGIRFFTGLGELEFDGKRLAFAHGDDGRIVKGVLDRQAHDYLLVGHSHVRQDRRVGRMRVINPGALHRAVEKTVALLDVGSDRLQFLKL